MTCGLSWADMPLPFIHHIDLNDVGRWLVDHDCRFARICHGILNEITEYALEVGQRTSNWLMFSAGIGDVMSQIRELVTYVLQDAIEIDETALRRAAF